MVNQRAKYKISLSLKTKSFNKIYTYATLLAIIIVSFGISEIRFYTSEPTTDEIEDLAARNVGTASKAFERFLDDFEQANLSLLNEIKPLLLDTLLSQKIYDKLEADRSFWGTALVADEKPLVWTGFKLPFSDTLKSIDDGEVLLELQQIQNVIFIKATQYILGADNEKYTLLTSKKLKQRNILDLGSDTELTVSEVLELEFDFPVHFSLFEPVPDQLVFKTEQFYSDSIKATIYAENEDTETYLASRKVNHAEFRLLFIILILVFGTLLLINLTSLYDSKRAFLISTTTLFIVWILSWVLLPELELELILGTQTVQFELFYLGLNCFLAFAFSFFISDFYYSNHVVEQKIKFSFGLIASFTIGFLISVVLAGILMSLFRIAADTPLNLNDLKLVPDLSVFFYYFFSGILWISVSWSIVYLMVFIINSIKANGYVISLCLLIGFTGGVLFTFFFFLKDNSDWILYTISGLFILLLSLSFFSWNGMLNLRKKSRLRLFLAICLVASTLAYIPFYFGQIEWRSQTMVQEAEEFAQQSELEIQSITVETLYLIEEQLSNLNITDINAQKSMVVSEFNNQIQFLFNQNPELQSFAFSIQLIDTNGDPLSEFTSNLNAPGWTKTFDMFSLEVPFVQERIRRDRLRPIIRKNPLEQPSAKYTSFRQGWIPFFSSPTSVEKMGWIICSVYQEQPQYRKPLRAVIASKKEEDKNSTFLLSEYIDNKLVRNSISGLPIEIPNYTMIPSDISEKLSKDSLYSKISTIDDTEVIEYFSKRMPNRVIKVSTLKTTLFNHTFSLLRFFFYLLGIIFVLSLTMQWKRNLQILGANEKFRDRLIDRFILASLICLIVLIAASSMAITKQSEEITIDELENKLIGVHTTFENTSSEDISYDFLFSSTLINSDAVLFEGTDLIGSTAPQIFSQHLLPAQIPWNVYNAIIFERSQTEIHEFQLGGLQFLIGYTPILNGDEVTNIAAIPTFLKTPTFNEQLLTTISYLVGLFVLIFGLFILAAALIANKMTSPLEKLSIGIKSISEGSLETTLSVKSKDEIGSLTNAFNIMVYRLQELRKNLVEAEREAAWKEMAQQVAHEIKNPLTPMKLNLQHLDRQIKSTDISQDELKEKVTKINSNMIEQIESLSRIASDFSKFARPMEQEFVALDVNAILQNVADLYSNEQSIKIDLDLNKNPLLISGVKDELQRVFINLVKNGIEAIPKRQKGIISIKSWHANYKANIEISDNGAGIPEDNRASIFVPNFSTKSSGTGLGLAISKKVVEEHGGKISFTSTPGKGTTFKLHFDLFTGKPS